MRSRKRGIGLRRQMEEIPRTMIKTNPRIPAMQQPESINHPDWQGRAGQMAPEGITLRKKKSLKDCLKYLFILRSAL